MTPEEKARKNIDKQLAKCGWLVQDYRAINITAGLGVAVREQLAEVERDRMQQALQPFHNPKLRDTN